MKKALIWITVGGLAVAGTAYILIKQNKKKTTSIEQSNSSTNNNPSNIIKNNTTNNSVESGLNLSSNNSNSNSSINPSSINNNVISPNMTPKEIVDYVGAKKLSGEIDELLKELQQVQGKMAELRKSTTSFFSSDYSKKSLEFATEQATINNSITTKIKQLTALGYAKLSNGEVRKI